MKTWTDIKAWMEWKGIKSGDILLIGSTMGFLLSVTIVLVWALIESLG
jgi:hypothetical protein